MATAVVGLSASRMSVGRVFERAFATVRQNPLVTLSLAFVFGVIPNFGVQYAFAAINTAVGNDPAIWVSLLQLFGVFFWVGLVGTLSEASLTRPVIARIQGEDAGLVDCALATLVNLIPLLLLAILSIGLIALGFVLFIVPGILLWVAWSVAVPVLIVERKEALASLRRSADLTRGAKLSVFGALVILIIVSGGLSTLIELATGEFNNDDLWAAFRNPAYLALTMTIGTITIALSGSVIASLYVELRDWKEGPARDTLEDVFA